MALAQISTIGRLGIRCFPIVIEVDVSPGMPGFNIVGLPDTIVQESKERIRTAIKNSGATFPLSRITVNLAPADIKKEGIGFDLPIAIGILVASEQLNPIAASDYFYGELGLQGELKLTRGVLSFVLAAREKAARIFIPVANAYEGGLVNEKRNIFGVTTLETLMHALKGEDSVEPVSYIDVLGEVVSDAGTDFADVHGQVMAKRALEIAAAGHHNILLSGPPGSGKTLLSRALPGIMSPLTRDELLETTQLYSVAGLLGADMPILRERPFRSPHHSASLVALVGGGTPPRPGEITLSHNGVLFLDEFAEFPRSVIEALRQPLEDRVITVARAGASVEFPAHCLLVAAVNPCPCGYKDDPKHTCNCAPQHIVMYQKKLSGPILDRIDIHVTVPAVDVQDLTVKNRSEASSAIRVRVSGARKLQETRYKSTKYSVNSQLKTKDILLFCKADTAGEELLMRAIDKFSLSARGYHKVLKVARTIADLDGSKVVSAKHIAEALQYRPVINA